MRSFDSLFQISGVIDAVTLYRMDVSVERHFSFGSWSSRQHGLLKIASGEEYGWGEEVMAVNTEGLELAQWSVGLERLSGMTVGNALLFVQSMLEDWGTRKCEMVEMALIDLAGKLLRKPSVELLGLTGMKPVPGLYCVLEKDEESVEARAKEAVAQGYRHYLKVKLFGDPLVDERVVRAARHIMGEEAYIVGDVNTGYRTRRTEASVDDIAAQLLRLQRCGLSACEDPAALDRDQWVTLQKLVGSLDLIPDYPLRPAREAIHTIVPGMGTIFNIHPGAMGSLLEAIKLAEKIDGFGGRIMIGDNSLIGPACTVWQQLAIGLQAEWVEALEKKEESESFLQCLVSRKTSPLKDGKLAVSGEGFGFALQLDEQSLGGMSVHQIRL